jgi:hypothetical protein
MDWSNERYVRLYVRDTETWLELSWQARTVWMHVLRKVDRAGVLETRRGARGIARIISVPVDVVEVALPELVTDGCLEPHPLGYVVPNFIAAQEAPQSDRQRMRESRARRREWSRAGVDVTNRDPDVTNRDAVDNSGDPVDNPVTNRDAVTERDSDVTNRIASVTSGYVVSRGVTSCHSDLTDLTLTDPDPEALSAGARAIPGSTDTAPRQSESPEVLARRACAETLWEAHQRARIELGAEMGDQGVSALPVTDQGRTWLAERLFELASSGLDYAEARCRHVLEVTIADSRRDHTLRYLSGRMWEKGRFDMANAQTVGDATRRQRSARNGARRPTTVLDALLEDIAAAEARGEK